MQVSIVDYGMGNIKSVVNALHHLKLSEVSIATSPEAILGAESLILPGVGSFATAMHTLQQKGLVEALNEAVLVAKKPILAICLGMQLLVESSQEGEAGVRGLGWIPGEVRRLCSKPPLRIPHMGWNDTRLHSEAVLFADLPLIADFYYVHSFHVCCAPEYVTASCDYGGEISVSLQKGHIFATQFHPEKSQHNGLKVLSNYLNYVRGRAALC